LIGRNRGICGYVLDEVEPWSIGLESCGHGTEGLGISRGWQKKSADSGQENRLKRKRMAYSAIITSKRFANKLILFNERIRKTIGHNGNLCV
jgi:hypothetical protein